MKIKLRLSPWHEDRLGPRVLWASEPLHIQNSFEHGWISFDVPHVELKPGGKYIAWLSAVGGGQKGDENAVIGIVAMGPRTTGPSFKPGQPWQPDAWISVYPEGTRAFWRQNESQSSTDRMSQLPWVVDRSGQNLHFKMIFEDRGRQ